MTRSFVSAVLSLALAVSTAPLAAQHEGHNNSSKGAAGEGVGKVEFPNSGKPAAQPAFLRGLALLHSFEYGHAATAFKEAQRIDPKFAMAYWGEAMTYNHGVWNERDIPAARAALARLGATPAKRLAKARTAREKDYLRALDVLYADTADARRDTLYAAAMGELAQRYPDDPDAQLFYALSLLSLMPRTDSTYERAGAIASKVLNEHPEHPGALHYVIHAYDDPKYARGALPAARQYAKTVPGAFHAQHMASHIFIAVGLWDDVVAANEAASPNARKFGDGAPPDCGHYGSWLQYAYLQQGRLAEAQKMTEACRKAGAESERAAIGFAQMRLRHIMDADAASDKLTPSLEEVLSLSAAKSRPAGETTTMVRALEGYGTAYAALRSGDTAAALPLVEQYQEHRREFANSPMARRAPEVVGEKSVVEQQLTALLMLRRGDTAGAIYLLRRSAALADSLPFAFGPPPVEKPPRELLGEVLLASGRAADAKREFEQALARAPGRSLALLGLARATRASGDTAGAVTIYRQLVENWHRADPDFPLAAEARAAAGDSASVR